MWNNYKIPFLVFAYLVAIVAANLVIATYGPAAAIIVAFAFIGLDLTTRDFLHHEWEDDFLIPRMFLLILAGSIISYLVNSNTATVALASFVAFLGSGIADTVSYSLLGHKSWLVKVNGSNVVSSTVDSFLFPTIAFGSFLPLIVIGQIAAKIFGGFIWGFIIHVVARYTGESKYSSDQGVNRSGRDWVNDYMGKRW